MNWASSSTNGTMHALQCISAAQHCTVRVLAHGIMCVGVWDNGSKEGGQCSTYQTKLSGLA